MTSGGETLARVRAAQTQVLSDVRERLGQLSETARRIETVGGAVTEVRQLLQVPRLRGTIGELWLEELEKRGGISVGGVKHKVKLVYSDYQSQTPRAVQLAEKLISSDKVNFLFSPFGSGAIKAASSVAEKYGVPMMASTASSKEVYDQNYKNLFGLYTPNDTLSEPIAVTSRSRAASAASWCSIAISASRPARYCATAACSSGEVLTGFRPAALGQSAARHRGSSSGACALQSAR